MNTQPGIYCNIKSFDVTAALFLVGGGSRGGEGDFFPPVDGRKQRAEPRSSARVHKSRFVTGGGGKPWLHQIPFMAPLISINDAEGEK